MANFYIVAGITVIVVLFLAMLAIGKYQQAKFVPVKVGNATVNAELADTQPKQVRGLMFRESLPKDDGMLFVFDRDARHGIWMMNTSIPLDIVWLDSGKRVVHVESGVKPCDALAICPIYRPGSNARYVLEVSSGYAEKHGIEIGSVAKFDLK